MTRPATHSGTWYEGTPSLLGEQIDSFLDKLGLSTVRGARVIVAPHAGYAYSGSCMGKLFAAWDSTKAETIFVLGPSHHVYFEDQVKLSKYSSYETPLGTLPVDTQVVTRLHEEYPEMFSYMSHTVDDDEHSIEMLIPFLVRVMQKEERAAKNPPKIVPILISDMNDDLAGKLATVLGKYAHDTRVSFLISSDFCHWGNRFRYTHYWNKAPSEACFQAKISSLVLIHKAKSLQMPIYQSIEGLDKAAMAVASLTNYEKWREYIELTGNTICGQKPIGVIILMMQREFKLGVPHLNWTGYAQSGKVASPNDSSVSYASGYAILPDSLSE